MDMNVSTLWEIVKDGETWWATIHGVAKSQKRLSNNKVLVGFLAGEKKKITQPGAGFVQRKGHPGGECLGGGSALTGDGSVLGPLGNEKEAVWLVLGPQRLRDGGK